MRCNLLQSFSIGRGNLIWIMQKSLKCFLSFGFLCFTRLLSHVRFDFVFLWLSDTFKSYLWQHSFCNVHRMSNWINSQNNLLFLLMACISTAETANIFKNYSFHNPKKKKKNHLIVWFIRGIQSNIHCKQHCNWISSSLY